MSLATVALIIAGVLFAIGVVLALIFIVSARSERRQDDMRRAEDQYQR